MMRSLAIWSEHDLPLWNPACWSRSWGSTASSSCSVARNWTPCLGWTVVIFLYKWSGSWCHPSLAAWWGSLSSILMELVLLLRSSWRGGTVAPHWFLYPFSTPLLGYCRVLLTCHSSTVGWPGTFPSWWVDHSRLVGHHWLVGYLAGPVELVCSIIGWWDIWRVLWSWSVPSLADGISGGSCGAGLFSNSSTVHHPPLLLAFFIRDRLSSLVLYWSLWFPQLSTQLLDGGVQFR